MSPLSERIDAIERGYEYLLAYAAQGRRDDTGSEVRATLTAMHAALNDLGNLVLDVVREETRQAAPGASDATAQDASAFFAAFSEDARRARGAIALVLSRAAISSLLVDNLNASIHLRALLTDVFLIDQALKS